MEIDRDIVVLIAEQQPEQNITPQPCQPSRSRGDDDLRELRIAFDDRRGCRLDHVTDLRIGKSIAKSTDGWCRKNDIANLPQTNQQDLQSLKLVTG